MMAPFPFLCCGLFLDASRLVVVSRHGLTEHFVFFLQFECRIHPSSMLHSAHHCLVSFTSPCDSDDYFLSHVSSCVCAFVCVHYLLQTPGCIRASTAVCCLPPRFLARCSFVQSQCGFGGISEQGCVSSDRVGHQGNGYYSNKLCLTHRTNGL